MQVRWYGHASFRLSSPSQGQAVFLDPFGVPPAEMAAAAAGFRFDYPPIRGVGADLVLVTHEHFDHNAVETIEGTPQILRARAGTFDTPIGKVTGVVSDHDTVAGTQRGMNAIYVFSLEGFRVCHFGDYGQSVLRPEQAMAIGAVDILMLPVGGGPTIDGAAAIELARRLAPRWVVPMHYRSGAINFLEPADAFLKAFDRVERLARPGFDTADLPLPSGDGPVVVMPSVPM